MEKSWPFCPQCGTILDTPSSDLVKCQACPFSAKLAKRVIREVVTRSAPTIKPTWINDEDQASSETKHATVQEPCPKCGHHEQFFYTMQLRSADEGSTVFYECPKCHNKYNQNN
jgi:DNA-directed RNA polymerase I subunit RPA12